LWVWKSGVDLELLTPGLPD